MTAERDAMRRELAWMAELDSALEDWAIPNPPQEDGRECGCRRAPVDARQTLLVARNDESPDGWWMCWAKEVER